MSPATWSYEQARQHFFIYLERTGTADLFHELRVPAVAGNPALDVLAKTLLRNLTSSAYAASAPFYTAMMGAHSGRTSAIWALIEQSARGGDRDVLRSAVFLLEDSAAFIDESLDTLRLVHERNLMPDAFQDLLRQSTIAAWGAFEAFCFDLFRLLFTKNLDTLRAVVAAQGPSSPWSGLPRKLLTWMEEKALADPAMSHENAFDSFRQLPSMQLRAIRHFAGAIIPHNKVLLDLLGRPDLVTLSARRHLLVHASGVVDSEYVAVSHEALRVGSDVVVTPHDLALGFRSASRAGAALAKAVAELL